MRRTLELYQVFLTPYSLFAIVIGLAYGVFLFRWGFYYDDWPEVYLFFNNLNVFDYYRFDRPVMAWTVFLLSRLAGTSTLAWQILALILRWALVSAFYWCFSLLWPKAKLAILIAALFFAVHPAYSLQPIAVTFSKVYLFYAVYFLSLGWMLKSLQAGRRSWIFTMLALATMAYHVFSLEYFWGLELARPLVIWFALSRQELDPGHRLRITLQKASPYLALIFVAIIWRIGFATYPSDGFYFTPEHTNPLVFLLSILSDFRSLISYLQTVLADIDYLLVASWNRVPLGNINWQIRMRFSLIILITLSVIFLFIWKLRFLQEQEDAVSVRSEKEIFWFGLFILLAGMLPVWSVGNHPSAPGPFDNRHALAALTGLCLLIAGLLASLRVRYYRWAFLSILIILAVSYQLQNGYDYYKDWQRQKAFFWQLYWRAPSLEPGSFVLSETPAFLYMTSNDVHLGPAVAVLYGNRLGTTSPSFWAFSLDALLEGYHLRPESLLEGTEIHRAVRTLQFRFSSTKALAVDYSPGQRCLWVLTAEDEVYPYWTERQRLLVELSAAEELIAAQLVSSPAPEIFGPEPPHTWCYYFQKASLARQFKDWETVVALGNTVFEKNLRPDDVYEWLPFLEGYLRTQRCEIAIAIAEEMLRIDPGYQSAVCHLFRKAAEEFDSWPEVLGQFQEAWNCFPGQ